MSKVEGGTVIWDRLHLDPKAKTKLRQTNFSLQRGADKVRGGIYPNIPEARSSVRQIARDLRCSYRDLTELITFKSHSGHHDTQTYSTSWMYNLEQEVLTQHNDIP